MSAAECFRWLPGRRWGCEELLGSAVREVGNPALTYRVNSTSPRWGSEVQGLRREECLWFADGDDAGAGGDAVEDGVAGDEPAEIGVAGVGEQQRGGGYEELRGV